MKKYWKLFWMYRRIRLMKMMEYRTDFIFWSVVSITWTFFTFFFFHMITNLSDTIGGWTKPELFVLVATFNILDAFTWSFFYRNMSLYTQAVFNGELDIVLTKPVDPQYLLSVQDNSYTNMFRFFIGIAVVVISLQEIGQPVPLLNILGYILFLFIGLLLIYSCWFILATCSFWIEKLENINDIFPSVRDIFRVPRTVYTGMMSFIFTTVIPLLLITSLPSEIILGRANWKWMVYFVISTTCFFLFSRLFFSLLYSKILKCGKLRFLLKSPHVEISSRM